MLTSTKNLAYSLHSRSAAKSPPDIPLLMGLANSIITNVFSREADPEELSSCLRVLCRTFVDNPLLTSKYFGIPSRAVDIIADFVASDIENVLFIFGHSHRYLKNSACHLRESSNMTSVPKLDPGD